MIFNKGTEKIFDKNKMVECNKSVEVWLINFLNFMLKKNFGSKLKYVRSNFKQFLSTIKKKHLTSTSY